MKRTSRVVFLLNNVVHFPTQSNITGGFLSTLSGDGVRPANLEHTIAVAGEIGNNSYDHNLGNWPDITGTFFAFDIDKKQIALADRGVGLLRTLKRVKPEIQNDEKALEIAFT